MFLETPRFPVCASLDYTMTSKWSEGLASAAGGSIFKNRNWLRSLKVFNVTIGPAEQDKVLEAFEFWEALAGPDVSFRFKDWIDYKSCRTTQIAAATDQVLEQILGSPGGGWQLQKAYTKGNQTTSRKILKPVQGTIMVADVISGVPHLKTEGVDWTLDYTSGLMQLGFTPTGTATWGGEFDVPVYFASDFPVQAVTGDVGSVSFQLNEDRDPQ